MQYKMRSQLEPKSQTNVPGEKPHKHNTRMEGQVRKGTGRSQGQRSASQLSGGQQDKPNQMASPKGRRLQVERSDGNMKYALPMYIQRNCTGLNMIYT